MGTKAVKAVNCHVYVASNKKKTLVAFLAIQEISFEEARGNHGSFRVNLSPTVSQLPELKGQCRKLKVELFT